MDSMSAFEDPFNLGDHQEEVEKIIVTRTCQIRVPCPWRSSTRIMKVFRVDDENLKRRPGVFKLARIFPSGGESRYRWAMEEFRVVPIAKNGGLVVTILQTAGRYIDGMRDILRALYIMPVHSKDALLSRLNLNISLSFRYHKSKTICHDAHQ